MSLPPADGVVDGGRFYVTTPIYYVNDRPHIGHCFTTVVADVLARAHRLMGREVFFLTGTDEHAEKVLTAAAERGLSPRAWADQNAAEFRRAFGVMGCGYDDFIRTSEDRHKTRASAFIARLVESGDIELGDYVGWWDPSQEEYLTETVAKESGYLSPVSGKPLEKRVEKNYFFRLSRYEARLRAHIESNPGFIEPEARRNEVLGRLKQGLQDVPVSRQLKDGDDGSWAVLMPGDPGHRVYVWIEALLNYVTAVDEAGREKWWPAGVHVMAKDILWFHAVIWPAMLMALGKELPGCVYAHAYYVAEGRKMSKSLGNFIEIDTLEGYIERYGLDALRWYLSVKGPLGANDADFAFANFVESYNADLANGIGNAASRVSNMIEKYFGGAVPDGMGLTAWPDGGGAFDWAGLSRAAVAGFMGGIGRVRTDEALPFGIGLSSQVDSFINVTRPFSVAKAVEKGEGVEGLPAGMDAKAALGVMLHQCAETLRVASLMLFPAMPWKMAELWRRWNCSPLVDAGDVASGFVAPLEELAVWGGKYGLKAGSMVSKGEALFMRADVKDGAPVKGS